MNVNIKSNGTYAVALLSGEIDHHNAKEIREKLDKFIISNQPRELAIDFRDISFMDSSGIGLIMGRYKLISQCGGRLIVKNPREYIKRVLKISGIERLVRIINDRI